MKPMGKEILDFLKSKGYHVTEEIEGVAGELTEMLDAQKQGLEDIAGTLQWLGEKKRTYEVDIQEVGIKDLDKWRVDEATGNISHDSGKFFSIIGVKIEGAKGREVMSWTQPMMKQKECGILGILCKKINGVRHYLLYAKFEPGTIASLQLSPTLQATESNLKQAHGGKKSLFAEYFESKSKGNILTSVVAVEDPGRFYHKTNRCMIVEIDENEKMDIPDDYIWLTLPQIKKLLKIDNIINALTRCVLGSR